VRTGVRSQNEMNLRLNQNPCAWLFVAAACLLAFVDGAAAAGTAEGKPGLPPDAVVPGRVNFSILTNLESRLAGKTVDDLCPVSNAASFPTNWSWNSNSPWFGMRGVSGLIYRREISITNQATYPYGGALVSPRFVMTCHHAGGAPGSVYWFMGTNGVAQSNVVIAAANLGTNYMNDNDAQINMLAWPVSNCVPLRVMPTNSTQWLARGFEALAQNDYTTLTRRLYVERCTGYYERGIGLSGSTNFPALAKPANLTPVSGNPILIPLGNELIFCATWFTAGGANWQCGSVATATNANAIMSNLCVNAGIPVEQLTPVDLSGWSKLNE
jgi:hypothetical protein